MEVAAGWVRRLDHLFAFFFAADLVFAGDFLVAAFLTELELASRLMSFVPMGEPRPVQASQPGPAEKAPLLPWVMSLKAEAALAA